MTASQVGQYAYCARAWWLGVVEGHPPADLEPLDRGRRIHERHGWRVSVAKLTRRVGLFIMGGAAISALIWALRSLL